MALVLGIDSSTQSVKVEVRDLHSGEVRGVGRSAHPPTTPPRSEQDPHTWWDALVHATHDALAAAGPGAAETVVAMAVAGQQHGMVATDDNNTVLHPAKLWNDTESAPQAALLVERFGADEWAQRVGSVPVAAFTVTKLAWLAQTYPEKFAAIAHVALPHDWLTYRLTGRHVTDRGDASGTGYWSPQRETYDFEVLDAIGVCDWAAMLPEVLQPFAVAGPLNAIAAEALGLRTDVVVAPGTGDNMAAALGLGLVPSDVAVSLGTSGTVYAVSPTPSADPTAAVAGFADASGNYLPLVCTLNATKVTDAMARLLGTDHAVFNELALAANPGANGLVLVPYLDGERTPNRPEARGVLGGIRSDVGREQFARAAFEGVVCGLLDGLDALAAVAVPTSGRLFLLGGGARSVAYRRVIADLAQRTVTVPPADEHVATGASLQAALVYGATQGTPPNVAALASAWGLGGGEEIGPDPLVDAKAIRSAYWALRDG